MQSSLLSSDDCHFHVALKIYIYDENENLLPSTAQQIYMSIMTIRILIVLNITESKRNDFRKYSNVR